MQKIDALSVQWFLFDPKFDGIRLHITINDAEAFSFINECMSNWRGQKLFHFKYDFIDIKKQEEIVIRKLREKFDLYEHLPFVFDISDIPTEIDAFCTLLSLDQSGMIRLYNARKRLENEDEIPKTFYISILEIRDGNDTSAWDIETLLKEMKVWLSKEVRGLSLKEKGDEYILELYRRFDAGNSRFVELQKQFPDSDITGKNYRWKLQFYDVIEKKKFKKTKKVI